MNTERLHRHVVPVATLLVALLVVWYLAAVAMNASGAIERVLAPKGEWGWRELVDATLNMQRPVLPAPHQIALDLWGSLVDWPVDSPRSLVYHTGVTAGAALTGFVMGVLLGLVLAICIVHSPTLDKALLPWIVASQTIPVLAIAPIVLVILGTLGFSGLLPKATIAMYLCFFPVTVAMVQGLRSPQKLETELIHTYSASRVQAFWMLRLPSSLPFLFPALKVAIAGGLVGTIVAELPTGAQAGLGARLLTGSYYGNTVQIWSALIMASLLGMALTASVAFFEYLVVTRRRQA